MDNTLPKVSVILANYNYGHYLTDALTSCGLQDYPNFDVIVIDDKSTDNSVEIIRSHCGSQEILQDSSDFILSRFNTDKCQVFLFQLKENGGPARARNIGIDFAIKQNSHMVQILDADDYMYPNKISRLVAAMIVDPELIGIVYADYFILKQDGSKTYESKKSFDFNLLYGGESIIHSGALISSLVLKRVGYPFYPPEQRVAEDFSLWLKACKYFMAVHVAEPLTLVRSHDQDSTNSVAKEIWQRDYQKAMMYR